MLTFKSEIFFSDSLVSDLSSEPPSDLSTDEAYNALESPLHESRRAAVRYLLNLFIDSSDLNKAADELLMDKQLPLLVQALSKVIQEVEEDCSADRLKDLRGVCNLLYLILKSGSTALVKDELEVCGTELEESLLRLLNAALEVSRLPMKKVVLLLSIYVDLHLTVDIAEEIGPITRRMLRIVRLQVPMRDLPPTNEVEAFYVSPKQRRMMLQEKPVLPTIVTGLIKVLLACCPNPSSVSPVVEIDQELSGLDTQPTHQEALRHRFILAYAIGRLLRMLVKRLGVNHVLQGVYLAQLVTDSQAVLVILKFLNQDFNALELKGTTVLKEGVFLPFELKAAAVDEELALAYRLTRGSKERIDVNLVQVKSHLILKRLLPYFSDNDRVTNSALKLLRSQIKYLPKKWVNYTSNMQLVTQIYLRLKPCHEDWLSGSFSNQKDVLSLEELRQLMIEFNQHNYHS
jgi:hypothetical protein